jgi:hypothetical protein
VPTITVELMRLEEVKNVRNFKLVGLTQNENRILNGGLEHSTDDPTTSNLETVDCYKTCALLRRTAKRFLVVPTRTTKGGVIHSTRAGRLSEE